MSLYEHNKPQLKRFHCNFSFLLPTLTTL